MPIHMSRDFRLKKRTIRHESFDDDESITIKSYYGDFDKQRVLSASTEYIRDEDTGQMRIIATLDRLHATKRELAVLSWNLKDEDGFPLPFNREVLMALPTDIATWLDEEINKDWGDLAEPVASKEEAEAKEKQAKEDRATFHRPSETPDGGAGASANGRADDGTRTERAGRRGIEAPSP